MSDKKSKKLKDNNKDVVKKSMNKLSNLKNPKSSSQDGKNSSGKDT